MSIETQYGRTLFIGNFNDPASVKKVARVRFLKNAADSADYDEARLQRLIMNQPSVLPVDQIEPAFANLVPICMELPTESGFLDNLLITPRGDLALIECKLWRNPEARRLVVAQIIDYAKDMSRWTYEKLEEAVSRTKLLTAGNGNYPESLFQMVSPKSEIDEATFHDAVSRNLSRGRFLLLIVGDGIREGVESMTEFLQQYAGLHFTLAIVELALFEVPTGGYIVQPRVLTRTTNIDRGIVTIDDSRITIKPPSTIETANNGPARRMTITKERYFEQLEKTCPGISTKLNNFIGKLAMYDVLPEFGTDSMILRWRPDDTKSWNLGTIGTAGHVWTEFLSRQANELGLLEVSHKYLTKVAAIVSGAFVKENPKGTSWYVSRNGKSSIDVASLLADEARENAWLQAIADLQSSITKALQAD